MGHIAFAAPTIQRYHFHEQLARKLLRSGHRVTVLCGDPVTWRFYRTQGLQARELEPGLMDERAHVPLDEFAQQDCHLAGIRNPNLIALRAARARLAGQLGAVLRFFETELPDLTLFHQGRSGLHRLIHFVGREFGCGLLHTGEGLLPHTMQWNEAGIDGNSSCCARSARDYRSQPNDELFLASALASTLGEAHAPPVARRMVHRPDLFDRISGVAAAVGQGRVQLARRAFSAWREALPRRAVSTSSPVELPSAPFVAVLLQSARSHRLMIDTPHVPAHADLVLAAWRATIALDPSMSIVVVQPPDGITKQQRVRLRGHCGEIIFAEATDALHATSIATAVVSVNHPLGLFGILSKTPVLHTGRSLYGIAGIATKTTLDTLETDLPAAIALPEENATLHERFLTRMLAYDHVWCSADLPDANGLRGLVQTIERQLESGASPRARPRYRAGPVWPLACVIPPEHQI